MVCRTSTPVPASRFPRRQHSASVLRAISDLVWRARWPDPGFVRVGGLPDACAARALKATKDLSRGFPNLSPVPAWRFPRREDLAYVLRAASDPAWHEGSEHVRAVPDWPVFDADWFPFGTATTHRTLPCTSGPHESNPHSTRRKRPVRLRAPASAGAPSRATPSEPTAGDLAR